ncbi:hypothetical protein L210DRAFT_3532122 [Boletus edulis BED1]|uniref:Uncharacterized protein n=1 Tax=Boletus edulis BED1 TaxID=1328754 RepID=A0AAD4BYK4_BOLED|nr:hypothetical protein L210DRAFT_3532122 [Boletus edulis BED1]
MSLPFPRLLQYSCSYLEACLPLGPPTSPGLFHSLYTTGPCQGRPSPRGKNTAGLPRTSVPM